MKVPNLQSPIPNLLLLILPILYLTTLAQTLVLGDPTEYTFIANIVGVAHPPGYVFMTLLGKLFQLVVPIGTIPWRMHLLAATAGTASGLFVFGTIRWFAAYQTSEVSENLGGLAGLFGALVVGTAVNHWQHSIHANPHIVTQTFLAANLYFLTRWAASNQNAIRVRPRSPASHFPNKWLYIFCLSAGLGVTHHPLTVFAFPAYAVFVVWQRPLILRQWRTLLKMVGCALLGLSLWLYLPLHSPLPSAVGSVDLRTLDAFLTHVLGRGISDDLGFYGLADLPNRLLVLWSILRLQYALPVLFLTLLALTFPFLDRFTPAPPPPRSPASLLTLYALALLGNLTFTLSLQRQDIMAYILGPMLIVGLLAGIGLLGLLTRLQTGFKLERGWLLGLAGAMLLLGALLPIVRNAPLVSLRGYSEGSEYVTAVFTHFANQNQGAVLLNDWEHMTPLWYTQLVEKRWPTAADVRPEFVSAARPWLPSVFDFLPGGPVYLSNYRREIVDAGFRLRPADPFYQVVEPGDETLPAELTPASAVGEAIEVVGYRLGSETVLPGDYIPLTLALRTPSGTADFYVPIVRVGHLTFPFTTDSHLTTPNWLPGEIIVERFDFALPHNLPAGEYPVTLGLKNLSSDTETPLQLDLGTLPVAEKRYTIDTSRLLANFRQRVGLRQATARLNGRRAAAPWPEPLAAQPGDTVHLTLQWEALDYAEESYTVFVHLIDLGNRPLVTLDYTPLGGAVPTHLWIPKWLPGQRLYDPYRLQIPPDLPSGQYLIEVGLYEMVSKRRLHMADTAGNLVGDRYILGSVNVSP
ncbi:MAG: DUF2723 domain-containing protein [Anaerolineales bacterium]|nr:DUF2723 domain-containing protein [Anaerolineales bacterium]